MMYIYTPVYLQAQLGGLDRRHISSGSRTDDNQICFMAGRIQTTVQRSQHIQIAPDTKWRLLNEHRKKIKMSLVPKIEQRNILW